MESQHAGTSVENSTSSGNGSPAEQQQPVSSLAGGVGILPPGTMQTLAPVTLADGQQIAMPMMQVPGMPHVLQTIPQMGSPAQGLTFVSQPGTHNPQPPGNYATPSPHSQGDGQGSRSGTPAQQQLVSMSGMNLMSATQQQQQQQQQQDVQQDAQTQGSPHVNQDSQQQARNGPSTPSPAPQSSESPHTTPGSIGSPMPQSHMFTADGNIVPVHSAMQMPLIYPQNMMNMGHPAAFSQGQLPPGFQQAQMAVAQQQQAAAVAAAAAQVPQQPKQDPQEIAKQTLKPPKKPLTPYMRFSKSIWQQVKAANPGLSVCEIGATIGKMWRELTDEQKQRYNEDFNRAKLQYDEDLQHYLKVTGLQASDLVKTKSKKKDKDAKHQLHAQQQQQQQQQVQQQQQQQQAAQHLNQMAAVNPFMATGGQPMGNFPVMYF